MGYTQRQTVRLLGRGMICREDGEYVQGVTIAAPFKVSVYCDPCAPSHRRFTLTYDNGMKETREWYSVLLDTDSRDALVAKIGAAREINLLERAKANLDSRLRQLGRV